MRIIHCTSVHAWDDVRIYHKMARSLARMGLDVHIIALDRTASRYRTFVSDGVSVHLIGASDIRTRFARALSGAWRVSALAERLRGNILHLHDPELLPVLFVRRRGRTRIVYDAHEDLGAQIESKPWIPPPLRSLFKLLARTLHVAARRADGLVAATPHIARKLGATSVVIRNLPLKEEFQINFEGDRRSDAVLYAGGITRARGALEMIAAVGDAAPVGVFHLAGTFESHSLRREAEALSGWGKVEFHGHLDRGTLASLMRRSSVGLVTFLPHPNHINAQPNKLFEYLGAGMLVVASDFPEWRDLLEPEKLAEFVDPTDPASIASGIARAMALPLEEQDRRRRAARSLIAERANWEAEFPKLLAVYEWLVPPR